MTGETEENNPQHLHPVSQRRPWVRYWARTIDLMISIFVFGLVASLAFPAVLEIDDRVFGYAFLAAYTIIESVMLSTFGTTPGKALLNIRLRKRGGGRLSLLEAFVRSVSVTVYGMGVGIPVITLATHFVAYRTLIRTGSTSWDRAGGYSVSHETVGLLRSVVACSIVGSFIALIVFLPDE